MAEENTATSSHLDSYMHVYDNGTTARLYVTPWDRNTVADGYWQTVNTIQPLINRDIYLADCIDKLAEKYTRYMPGYGISMEYNTVKDFWTISVDAEEVIAGIPKYNFNSNYFVTTPTTGVEGSQNVGLRFKNDSITADENGKGYYLPYNKNEIYYRFKFYGNNIKKGKNEFDGFITSGNLSLVSGVNKTVGVDTQYAYKQIDWDDWETQKKTGPSGAYTYTSSVSGDFVDYRDIFFEDQYREGNIFLDEIPDEKWSALSSQWMVYSYVGNNNYDYYYGHNNSDRPVRNGIKENTTFDLVWKGTATDKYGNDTPSTAQTFKTTGMSPSAGCNYTYSNVILENTIDLTNKTGYLQICYPYVTVYGAATNVNKNCGIIPQMIMTYEGTN